MSLIRKMKKAPNTIPNAILSIMPTLPVRVMLYLGSASGAGFISRKNLKNSDFVERINVSFWVNVVLYVSIVLRKL